MLAAAGTNADRPAVIVYRSGSGVIARIGVDGFGRALRDLARRRADNAQAMGPAFAVGAAAPKAGIVLAALAAAAVLLDRAPRRRCAWMALALALAAVILVDHISDTDQWHSLTDSGAALRGPVRRSRSLVVGAARVGVRAPAGALPVAVVAVLPFRVPIEAAGTTSNLLVPLYLVIAAGCAAFAWRTLREQPRPA